MELLPDTDDLIPLRAALLGAAETDGTLAWSGSEAYATLDTRLLDPDALEAAANAILKAERMFCFGEANSRRERVSLCSAPLLFRLLYKRENFPSLNSQ